MAPGTVGPEFGSLQSLRFQTFLFVLPAVRGLVWAWAWVRAGEGVRQGQLFSIGDVKASAAEM